MLRTSLAYLAALLLLPCAAGAQGTLVPTDRAPFRQRFDLFAQEAQYLLLPQGPLPAAEGPFRFRFDNPDLDAVLENGPALAYLTPRDGGFHLQVLHARPREVASGMLGPQRFAVEDAAGAVVGRGVMLVVGRLPEAGELRAGDGGRIFETGRAVELQVEVRAHGNLAGVPALLNSRDFELTGVREVPEEADGVRVFAGSLRPLRPEATELRFAAETRDGRTVEIVYSGVTVRPPTPRRIRVAGGPFYLDAAGRGSARLVVPDLPAGRPEVAGDATGEISILEQRYDPATGTLEAHAELVARTPRPPGSREVREITVRSGSQSYRGLVEVVGPPVVSGVRTESGRPAVLLGAAPALVRVAGQNLDGLHLDCAPLGPGARCRTVYGGPGELVAEVSLAPSVREGEHLLPLVGGEERPGAAFPQAVVKLHAEHPSIPLPLAGASFLRLGCEGACRMGADGLSVVARAGALPGVRLVFDTAGLPAVHGWQKLLVTVTRVRGEQRQVVRTFGTPAAPRMLRNGASAGDLAVFDAGADARHGDHFVVRVEHAAEQYPPEHRSGVATAEAFVRTVYVDGGAAKRFTGDIAVQPVLVALGGESVTPLYPNAGFGVTWQFLDARMEPRLYSAKLQLLATGIQAAKAGSGPVGQPALFLSGNLRIPGTDPARPLVLTTGVARMFGPEPAWRILMGGGIDLGVARLLFGG